MRDRRGEIIYVGKAKNLRRRVQSYFRAGAKHPAKVRSMVQSVWDFDFLTVKSDAEALLTEASLIKRHKPHFNILMRDDKRYLALRADPSARWPRFVCCRIIRDDGACYFGPFPSSGVVRTAKDFTEKRFGIRECDAVVPDAQTHRHCLADIIRTCSAPCLGRVTEDEYRRRFDEACAFLKGERPEVLDEVDGEMRKAAGEGDFEKAARLRDTLFALKEMTKAHFVRRAPELREADAREAVFALRVGNDCGPHGCLLRVGQCTRENHLHAQRGHCGAQNSIGVVCAEASRCAIGDARIPVGSAACILLSVDRRGNIIRLAALNRDANAFRRDRHAPFGDVGVRVVFEHLHIQHAIQLRHFGLNSGQRAVRIARHAFGCAVAELRIAFAHAPGHACGGVRHRIPAGHRCHDPRYRARLHI
jgi:hypothetical protein